MAARTARGWEAGCSAHQPSLAPADTARLGLHGVGPREAHVSILGPVAPDTEKSHEQRRLTLPHGDPSALEVISAIHAGDLDAVRRLIADRPQLATARMIGRKGVEGGWRTPLHAAADWPGYFPNAPAAVAILLASGADPNDDTGAANPETPLHWAASTDDVDVAVELVDGGADLERPGGSIGTPLDNAIGYGCWHVVRLLVERGAKVDRLWHAAGLGMLARLEELMADNPGHEEISRPSGMPVRLRSAARRSTCWP